MFKGRGDERLWLLVKAGFIKNVISVMSSVVGESSVILEFLEGYFFLLFNI